MKKIFFYKISAVFLSLALSFSMFTTAFAAEKSTDGDTASKTAIAINANFGDLMKNIVAHSEKYGLTSSEMTNFEVMQPIDIIDISENASNTADSPEIIHLPISDNTGKIVLVFDIITTENGVTCTMGPDFAPLLNTAKENGSNTVMILQDGFSIYAVSDNGVYLQTGKNVRQANEQQIIQIASAMNIVANKSSYDLFAASDEYTQLACSALMVAQNNANNVMRETPVTGSRTLSSYPIVGQYIGDTAYGLCWAATVASIVRFEKPYTYGSLTAQDVADYMHIGYDDGASNNEAKNALAHYLGSSYSPTVKSSVLTQSAIKTIIDGTDPAYMQCRRPNGFLSYMYHSVALIGYDFTSSSTQIEIMDPAYECYKDCTYSNGDWTFAFGTYTYTWIKTITID